MDKIIIIFLIIIGLSSCGGENSAGNLQKTCDSLSEQLNICKEENEMIENLSTRYKEHLRRYGQIQDSITEKEKKIDSLRTVISQRGTASETENKMLNQLLNQIENFVKDNQDLAQELEKTNYKNSSFKQIVNILLNSSASKQKELNYITMQMEELQNQVNGLNINNEYLTNRINTLEQENSNMKKNSQKLSFSNIKINLPKNLTGAERKAKNIDSIMFSFNINKNDYAPRKNINIYIRMADENGNIVYNSENNVFKFNGKNIAYTTKTQTNYNGEKKHVELSWTKQNNPLHSGTYSVSFFVDNYEVTTESLYIK